MPVFLLTGAGGAGKSVVMERLGFDLSRVEQPHVVVLRLPKGSVLDTKDFQHDYYKATKDAKAKVVALFIDEASHNASGIQALLDLAQREHFRLFCFLADQTNKRDQLPRDAEEFALGKLTDREIHGLLALLEKTNNMGVLKDKSASERFEFFKTFADKQLLVALREATTGKRFDTIIFEEWEHIPSDEGKSFYLFVAILHAVEAYLPEEAARRAFRCLKEPAVWRRIRDSCREIVSSSRTAENGMGTALKARHPIIAEALVHARFLEKHTAEDANDFAEDAAEILYALDAMRTEQNKRAVFALVRQLVLSKTFATCISAATNIKSLCEAMSNFDEVWEGRHNNFIIQAYHAWERHGTPTLAGVLLEEAVALGESGVACLAWCVGHFADRLIQTNSPEQIVRGIQRLHRLMADYEAGKVPHWLTLKISALYHAAGDKDSAIKIIEAQFSKTSDEDSAGRGFNGIALSQMLERRYLEKHDPKDLKRSLAIIEELMADNRVRGRHGDLITRYARLVQEPQYREHLGDLDSAITMVERGFAALKDQPEGDPATAAIALSHLFERRYSEKLDSQDLFSALNTLKEFRHDLWTRNALESLITRFPELAAKETAETTIADTSSEI